MIPNGSITASKIANGSIYDATINASANISLSKINFSANNLGYFFKDNLTFS